MIPPDLRQISTGPPAGLDNAAQTAERIVRGWRRSRLARGSRCVRLLGVAIGQLAARGQSVDSSIDKDEQVVFFPTSGYRTPDDANWVIQVHGWIYEPEHEDDSDVVDFLETVHGRTGKRRSGSLATSARRSS